MGLPEEVLDNIFTVIEGGQSIGTSAEIIQFPSDNGQQTFTAVNKIFKGSNGTGLNYWVAAVAQGASAISAGALFISVAIPEFIAFAVPCLGIGLGTAFYNIDPEGWTNLAGLLYDAGWTVKNKVVGFMLDKGVISFPPATIEILKDELIRLGAFEVGDSWTGEQPEDFNVIEPVVSSDKMFTGTIMGESADMYYMASFIKTNVTPNIPCIAGFKVPQGLYFDYKVTSGLYEGNPYAIMSSKHAFYTEAYSFNMELDSNGISTVGNAEAYTYDGKTVYFVSIRIYFTGTDYITLGSDGVNFSTHDHVRHTAWIMQYGEFDPNPAQQYQQKGAIFPSEDEPFLKPYPEWIPFEFPELPGWQIPEVMPIQYPQLIPTETEPYQHEAQNPEGDDDTADEGVKVLEDPANDPVTGLPIDPAPQPDPDPQPVSPEDIENPAEDTDVNPDPIEPDPPVPPSPIIPVPSLPDTVHSSKLFTVYNPTATQLGSLGGYLWDNDLIDILRKIWQNPLDGIISLIQVYATPVTSGSSNIILGYLDSGVSAAVVSSQFVTIDCGSITVNELSENCLDYIPHTKMELYLPFIGITEIDTNDFMAGTISVKYKVDVYTGTCLAEVKCTRSRDLANGAILYTFSGNCSQQLPLTSGDAKGVFGALVGAAGVALGIATGGASLAGLAGAVGATASREMLHIGHSGNLSANAGIMGQKKPYLIINRERPYTANSYNRYYGFPANKTVTLGNHTGYVRVKAGRLQSRATANEQSEIMALLKNGVIL